MKNEKNYSLQGQFNTNVSFSNIVVYFSKPIVLLLSVYSNYYMIHSWTLMELEEALISFTGDRNFVLEKKICIRTLCRFLIFISMLSVIILLVLKTQIAKTSENDNMPVNIFDVNPIVTNARSVNQNSVSPNVLDFYAMAVAYLTIFFSVGLFMVICCSVGKEADHLARHLEHFPKAGEPADLLIFRFQMDHLRATSLKINDIAQICISDTESTKLASQLQFSEKSRNSRITLGGVIIFTWQCAFLVTHTMGCKHSKENTAVEKEKIAVDNAQPAKLPMARTAVANDKQRRLTQAAMKRKMNQQLSCVPANRSVARRTRLTHRVLSKAAGSTLADEDKEEDKAESRAIAQYLISISPFNKRWKVIETINEGTYGFVFAVQDVVTKCDGVIKVAKNMSGGAGNNTANWESFIFERVYRSNPNASVVRVLDRGMLQDKAGEAMEFMVLEKAKVDVETWLYEITGPSRRVRVCQVAMHMLKGIYDLHMQGLLHRDLKPKNMGIASRESPATLLFDLGMSRMYTDRYGSNRTPRTVVQFRGTEEWASGHAEKGRDQTRYDDLISWLYVIVDFFAPNENVPDRLPWSNCGSLKARAHLKSTFCPAQLLLRNCPLPFYAINTYLQTANRLLPPNYEFIADRVMESLQECSAVNESPLKAVTAVNQSPSGIVDKNTSMSNSSRNENGTGSVFNSTLNGGSTFVDAATFREKSNTSWPSVISHDSSGFASLCRHRSSHFVWENSEPPIISETAENDDEMTQQNPRIEQPADAPNNNAVAKSYPKRILKRISSIFSLNHLLPSTRKRNASSSAPANSSQNNGKLIEIKKTKRS
ncbi:protein kinase domain-containing protein [Ditylenchus destructor]|nr:protein kinase domain-containing protein [Ditylenchus destructor]